MVGIRSLVALMFEMFAVAVVNQESVRVVFADPLHLLNIKCALGLDPLSFPSSWNRDGKAWTDRQVIRKILDNCRSFDREQRRDVESRQTIGGSNKQYKCSFYQSG